MLTRRKPIVALAVIAGALLTLIGIRFLLVPDSAAKTFGLTPAMAGAQLHAIIGLRDIWLGALAIAFALLGQWRALALWFLFGVLVCWADAAIVATSGGPRLAIAFHTGSGVFCLVLGVAAWRLSNKEAHAG
ncbi:conserved membrane protein of unknown function [Candidatus Filomicrobium marinum]|uniref:DUF4267 domain-containing protein n=2 Tax=Filomicrobium TaxID=119044 RepID=A0A0D6JHH3_9HYPH|nr:MULTISPECIES: DUF4267 domain-containing protein [Filomicrobium]MCV0369490.1 DUF4267 domain-containing protein [Filomicrobium sp.]CFX43892.1 conserved membrane protein of unknown function [Candidatus Filomicrobium marinum]CPR20928.1 conserved membrane protein of unknown function [Candidatus Filomicrobium marinum]SDP21170.1 protein of unknown function [Filomicrobium insigne]